MTQAIDDAGYEPFPEPSRRRGRRWAGILLGLLVTLLLVAGVAAAWMQRQINPSGPSGAEVTVMVPEGASTQRIATILEEQGIITSARIFRVYVRIKGGDPFEAGEYTLRRRSSFDEAIATLRKGALISFDLITVPEGLTIKEIAARVARVPGDRFSADRFLQLAASGAIRSRYQPQGSTSLEGLLLPETYSVEAKDTEETLLRRMVEAFDGAAAAAGIGDAEAKVGLSPYQAIILASLIEEEAKLDSERTKISRVIHNRLARDIKLDIDATVIYSLGGCSELGKGCRVLFRHLEADSPYNTYRVKGLPPTPIAAARASSLRAAVEPADGPWLFYVKCETDGTHCFSTTNAEHNRNIADAKRRGVNP